MMLVEHQQRETQRTTIKTAATHGRFMRCLVSSFRTLLCGTALFCATVWIFGSMAARADNCSYGNTNPSCPNNASAERQREQQEARERAMDQARERAQQEAARERAMEGARQRAEEEARARAQEEARERAQEEARERAQDEARERAQDEARERAAQQDRQRAQGDSGQQPSRMEVAGAQPAGGQRAEASRSPAVRLDRATLARVDPTGFEVQRQDSPRSTIVLARHVLSTPGPRAVPSPPAVYRNILSTSGKTTTRVYLNGLRDVQSARFSSRGQLGGPQFVHYPNGLRSVYLTQGGAVYAETAGHVLRTDAQGKRIQTPVVRRTVFTTFTNGRPVPLVRPIHHYYTPTLAFGVPVLVYQPVLYPVAFVAPFLAPLAAPVSAGPDCPLCQQIAQIIGAPQPSYSDPMDLLGDMEMADAVGDQGLPPDEPPPDADAGGGQGPADEAAPQPPQELLADATDTQGAAPVDLDAMQAQAESLQDAVYQQPAVSVDPSAGGTPAATGEPTSGGAPIGSGAAGASGGTVTPTFRKANFNVATTPEAAGPPLSIPPDVREQVRREVRLIAAEHTSGHVLTVNDVLHSGYVSIFVFQIAEPVDAVSSETGDRCVLTSGDLVVLAAPATAPLRSDLPSLPMRVAASREGHCASQDTVDLTIPDLQEMLNTFNQRVEADMKKLSDCLAPSARCLRT
jgi:hypothetical protein